MNNNTKGAAGNSSTRPGTIPKPKGPRKHPGQKLFPPPVVVDFRRIVEGIVRGKMAVEVGR